MPYNFQNFSGELTSEIRQALIAQRQTMGFTLQRAANFCQVNVSTYRKWENGPTKNCGTDKIKHLKNFLLFQNAFKYLQYNMHSDSFYISVFRFLPEQFYIELERQFTIIHLSQNHKAFQNQYLNALRQFNQEQLKLFIENNQKNNQDYKQFLEIIRLRENLP